MIICYQNVGSWCCKQFNGMTMSSFLDMLNFKWELSWLLENLDRNSKVRSQLKMNIWELLWKLWLNFGRSYNLLGKENWERYRGPSSEPHLFLNVYYWKFCRSPLTPTHSSPLPPHPWPSPIIVCVQGLWIYTFKLANLLLLPSSL